MNFREHAIDEALRRHFEFERRFGKSQLELLNAQSYERKLASETSKLIQDINKLFEQQTFRAIESINLPAREVVSKNLAEFHAFAASSIAQTELDTLKISMFADKERDYWRALTSWATPRVTAYFAVFASKFSKDTLDRTAQAVAEATKFDISKLGAIGGSSALAALDFSNYDKELESIRALHNSYSGQLAAALRECFSAEEITEENFKPIEELLESKIDSLPQGRISAEGLLTILLTLMSVLIAHGAFSTTDSSTTTEKATIPQGQQLGRLTSLWTRMVQDTARLLPERDRSTYYKVDRQVTLWSRPDNRAEQVVSLLPEQKSRLVQRKHKWIYVEYFDEIEGIPKYGWANKKYLKKINKGLELKLATPTTREALTAEERIAITDQWEQTNAKRVELIHKKLANVITHTEKQELDRLQNLMDKRIRLLAPLPINALASFLEDIERRT